MTSVTKRNIKAFIEDTNNQGLDKFPQGMTLEAFEMLTPKQQENIIRVLSGRPHFIINSNVTKPELKPENIKLTKAQINTMLDKLKKQQAEALSKLKDGEPAPKWTEIETPMQNNFKKWLGGQTKKYDEKFSVKLFDELPDTVKVEFYFTLAKRFGVRNYWDLKSWKRSANDLVMGVKDLKISEEIQEAIYDVIPVTKSDLLQVLDKSEMDNWDAKTASDIAKGMAQEEIDAARENRKADKKMAKLKARVKSMMSLEQYTITLSDPLFDRGMYETILKRMENSSAFKDTWQNAESKEIIKLIVNHPLATTNDLIRINKMKTTRWGGSSTPLYNSSHLNTALAAKDDLPVSEVMKLIKLQQYDLKVKAAGRSDLSDADKSIIIEYTIKHHSHMPDQLKEIFEAMGKTDQLETSLIRGSIIAELKKKYTKGSNWSSKPNGLKFLEVMDNYGWFSEMTPKDKQDMAEVIAVAYEQNRLTKDRIVGLIDRLGGDATEFLALIYERTGDEDFLPAAAKDMFLF